MAVLLLVVIVYYRLQRFYRASSRSLRRLDSVHRSPVFALICDCAVNAACLRSLGAATGAHFEEKLRVALDESLRVSLAVNVAAQVR